MQQPNPIYTDPISNEGRAIRELNQYDDHNLLDDPPSRPPRKTPLRHSVALGEGSFADAHRELSKLEEAHKGKNIKVESIFVKMVIIDE